MAILNNQRVHGTGSNMSQPAATQCIESRSEQGIIPTVCVPGTNSFWLPEVIVLTLLWTCRKHDF